MVSTLSFGFNALFTRTFINHSASLLNTSIASDQVRAGVVVLIGSLSQHLAPSDSRIPEIVQNLLEALKVPSEHVQSSVAECLPPLIKQMSKEGFAQ